MGCVLADGAAYTEEEARRLIFTCLFSLSLVCDVCVFYVELCTTYPVIRTVVQRRNITMIDGIEKMSFECWHFLTSRILDEISSVKNTNKNAI